MDNEKSIVIYELDAPGNGVTQHYLLQPKRCPICQGHFDPSCLWWKHELLHRRTMAEFDNLVPQIRKDFDTLENEFVAESESIKKSTLDEKHDFMEYCFHKAMQATDTWISRLRARTDLTFKDAAYQAMWRKFNAEAGLTGMPD